MDKSKRQYITRPAVYRVLREYLREYKNRPLDALVSFVLPPIGSIFIFFVPPLIISRIVNEFSSGSSFSFPLIGKYAAVFALSLIVGEFCWRTGVHFTIRLEAAGVRNLAKRAFRDITHRDYDFYVNSFVGTLTRKITSFHSGFEKLTDTLQYSVLSNIFPLVFATAILWRYI